MTAYGFTYSRSSEKALPRRGDEAVDPRGFYVTVADPRTGGCDAVYPGPTARLECLEATPLGAG